MKAVVYEGPGRVKIMERSMPSLQKDEVMVQVEATGICGSDLHAYTGRSSRRKQGVILGHEIVGRVVELGTEGPITLLERRVVVQPVINCGACFYCQKGLDNLCTGRRLLGADIDGGMAEYIAVPAKNLSVLPGDISPQVMTLIEPAAVAVHALKMLKASKKDKLGFIGTGPLGLMGIFISSNVYNTSLILGVDLIPHRLQAAMGLGATYTLTVGDKIEIEEFIRNNPPGLDGVVDTGGTESSLDIAVKLLAKRGLLVALAGWNTNMDVNLQQLVTGEINLAGSFNYTQKDFAEAVSLLSKYSQSLKRLIQLTLPIEEAEEAFALLAGVPEKRPLKVVLLPET